MSACMLLAVWDPAVSQTGIPPGFKNQTRGNRLSGFAGRGGLKGGLQLIQKGEGPGREAGEGAGVRTVSGAGVGGRVFLADGVQGASLAAKATSRLAGNPGSLSLACVGWGLAVLRSTSMSPAWLSPPCASFFPLSQERWGQMQILFEVPAPSSQPRSTLSLLSCCFFFSPPWLGPFPPSLC